MSVKEGKASVPVKGVKREVRTAQARLPSAGKGHFSARGERSLTRAARPACAACCAGTRPAHALCAVPYASTASYKDIAVAINNPKAVRAVGQANNKNPIPIFIPCHRIIGSNGKLIGYGGGLEIKALGSLDALLCQFVFRQLAQVA